LGDGHTINDCANILAFPMLVIDAERMAWLLSTGGDEGILQHVSTAMISARDMIFQNLRAKVGSSRVSPMMLASRVFEPLRESSDSWFASHVMINNISSLYRKDPDHALPAIVAGLASLGVPITLKFVKLQMESERNRLLMGGRHVFVIQLPVVALKGGGMCANDDMSSVLRRQRFVTYTSDGREWADKPEKPRRLNFEFIPDDAAPFLETATFLGSIRGFDSSDSGICGAMCMLTRLFSELRCSRIMTVVMDVEHKFRVGTDRNADYDEVVLGMMIRPNDIGLLEVYREILGISGQCRRVISCLGFLFELSSNFEVRDIKRVSTAHILLPVWTLRIAPKVDTYLSSDMVSALLTLGGSNVLFILPRVSKRNDGSRHLTWVAGMSVVTPITR